MKKPKRKINKIVILKLHVKGWKQSLKIIVVQVNNGKIYLAIKEAILLNAYNFIMIFRKWIPKNKIIISTVY